VSHLSQVMLLGALAVLGQASADEPFPAHRVIGNTYYVGSKALAVYLITTPEGHILINSGFEETVPLIRDSVEKLGFKMRDVKIILASHAHADHVGGHARLQELTGAKVYAMRGDVEVIASGGLGQYLYADSRWKPCPVDRVLEHGDKVKLGGTTLTAHLTPGHTRGCTTWTWRVADGGKEYDVVVIGSPNVNPGYRLVGNKQYPHIADDFAKTFEVLKALPCDVFLGAHGEYYGMIPKYDRLKATEKSDKNPFIDPDGYRTYVAQKEKAFRKTLAQQRGDYLLVCEDAGAGGYEAFPDVCRLSDGRLMVVFYAGYGHVALPNKELPKGGRICYCTSSDEGRTWSRAEILYDGPDDDRDPSIVQLKSGQLICNFFSLRKSSDPKGSYDGLGSWMVTSDDLGKTWSAPRQISKNYYCSSPIRELSSGRLILGLYAESEKSAHGAVIFSDDGGKTWDKEVDINNSGYRLDAETDIIELKDGTLYAAQRAHMCYATSRDRGVTWTASKPIGFAGHCPYFLRTKDDIILLAHRLPNTSLHYSLNECRTWSGNVPIDDVGGAYPSLVNLKDGSVLVVYYEEGAGSSIRAKRFRATKKGIEWLSWK
jgi:glyoxylase-like metal-dependent hydrolase (beta-lactamase superfamily II)